MSQFGNGFVRRDFPAARGRTSGLLVGALAIIAVLITTGCAGVNDNGTQARALATREARQAAAPVPETGAVEIPPEQEAELAAAGVGLSAELGCTGCHSVDGAALAGPTWQGLFGSEVPLENGETVVADEAYIVESIVNPQEQIHEGFQPIMPNTYATLPEDQLAALVAYIKSLGSGAE